jgi:hypothetical protein
MTTKDDLHHLVDELDEDAVGELLEYAQWLSADEDVAKRGRVDPGTRGRGRDRRGRLRHARGAAPQARSVSFAVRVAGPAEHNLSRLQEH